MHTVQNRRLTSISAVFPAYNDSWVICEQVKKIFSILPEITDDYEVIVVNDGSTDDTGARLESLKQKFSGLKVINHSRNLGYGGAVKAGLSEASKEFVFYTDGDAQYDVQQLFELVDAMKVEIDIVNGYKVSRSDNLVRLGIGKFYLVVMRWMFQIKIRDIDCDFRLMRKESLDKIELTQQTGAFCVELVKKLESRGARFREIPVNHFPRKHGTSQFFCFKHLKRTLISLIPLWFQIVLFPNLKKLALRLRTVTNL